MLLILSILLLILELTSSFECNVNTSLEIDFQEKYNPNVGTFLTSYDYHCPEGTNRKTLKRINTKDYWLCKSYDKYISPHKFVDWSKMLNESTGLYVQFKGVNNVTFLSPYIIDAHMECPIGTYRNSIEVIEYIRYKFCFPFPKESDKFVNWNKLLFDKRGLYIQ